MFDETPLSFVFINGARLAYRIKGNPSHPLFIGLHGGRGFGSHESEFAAWSSLTDRVRLLTPDFRGHGQSSSTPPYTFKQIVDDIESLRQHFAGDESAIICGGSFGGFLAQQYAITYPTKTRHLILRGTAPSHEHEKEAKAILLTRLDRAPYASPAMLDKVFGAFKDDAEMRLVMYSIGPLYSEQTYDADQGLEQARRTIFNAESHNALYSQEEKYFDYRPKLGDISAPTLIVIGREDWICPLAQSQILHESIPNSQLLIVDGANHSVHRQKPEIVLAAVRQFLGI